MNLVAGSKWALRVGVVAVVVGLVGTRAETQDPNLKPTFGTVNIKAGFTPDPFVKKIIAGGPIETKLGGVNAWVAKEPDFRVNYTAGNFALTFHVDCKEDTTLLINTPDGKWYANDDGAGNLNPLLKFGNPQSGQYDIWIGTFAKGGNPEARLFITELK